LAQRNAKHLSAPTKGRQSRAAGFPLQRLFAPPAAGTNVGVKINSAFAPPQAARTIESLEFFPENSKNLEKIQP
jgi:hypothetical protein